MATNILSIGQSALLAAQVGISTTGHNIANASTPGYSRQIVIQGAAQAQNFGYGYVGQGTQIQTIQRVYSDLLNKQVTNSQSTTGALTAYATQMKQIDSMLSDTSAGLSPAMQDFFKSVQDLSTNPDDAPSRQAMLSTANSLAERLQSFGTRISEIREGVNSQLTTSVDLVNTYAKQIAQLNDTIQKALNSDGQPPNDLMDQRDQLVSELSKQIQTSIVKQDGGTYNVFIGNGLPLVVGTHNFSLTTINSPTDANRTEVAYQNQGKVTILGSNSLPGGAIGGVLQFRSQSLDSIQNQLGLVATALAVTFNAQHEQAQDANGNAGTKFFSDPTPSVTASVDNTGGAAVSAAITDVQALTTSDYRLQYDGTNYNITRLDTGTVQTFASLPQTVDGVNFKLASGAMATGDSFLVQPTAYAATNFSVAITDTSKIAVGGPVLSSAALAANTGTGTITAPVLDSTYASSPLASPFTLTYSSGGNSLSGFPAGQAVTVTSGATTTTYPAPVGSIPYNAGDKISVAGLSIQISGVPANGDQFSVSVNAAGGAGDNRNALLLAALQTAKTIHSNSVSYGGAYGQLVSMVGNKTSELKINSAAETNVLAQVTAAQQAESGVNLDEEATNLLRYQQAYQAAGKMMQIASQMFDVLLNLKQ
jgi:flagellar hook-associated protein 1 FlgK